MGTIQFSADVDELARSAPDRVRDAVVHATNASQFNSFDLTKTIKYNLNRLAGLRLLTEDEQQNLNALVDTVASRSDPSSIVQAIKSQEHPSPLAVALAGIAAGSPAQSASSNLAGALVGTLILFGSQNPLLSGDSESVRAITGVLAAIGGAAAIGANANPQSQ